MKYHWLWSTLLAVMLGLAIPAKAQWSQDVTFNFPGENGSTGTGKFTVSAIQMNSQTDPGKPISDPQKVRYRGAKQGFVKFKLDNLTWGDPAIDGSEDDGTVGYLLFVHSNWVDSKPKNYPADEFKRRYIIAPNAEFTNGMARPPAITFICEESGKYRFQIGYRVTTPFTEKNEVSYAYFDFTLSGIAGKEVIAAETTETNEEENTEPEQPTEYYTAERLLSLYLRAETKRSPELFLEYYRNSDDEEKRRKVEEYLTTEFQIDKKGDVFKIEYILPNLGKRVNPNLIRVDSIRADGGGELVKQPELKRVRDSLFVTLGDSMTEHLIYARDPLGRPFLRPIKLVPGQDLTVKVLEDSDEKAEILIEGGTPPYSLKFTTRSGNKDTLEFGSPLYNNLNSFVKDNLSKTLGVKIPGIYKVEVVDDNGYVKIAQGTVFLQSPPTPPIVWFALAGAVLIAAGIVFWQWQKKQQENREMEVMLEQKKYEKTIRRKDKDIPEIALAQMNEEQAMAMNEPKDMEVDLDAVWRDSVTSGIVATEPFQRSLDQFKKDLVDEDHTGKDWLLGPGGLLLGQVDFSEETEAYVIKLEKIVPYQPLTKEQEDLLYGEEGWTEIRDAERENYGKKVIGWYQLREGNSLELDPEDVRLHSIHFREPYQLVMIETEDDGNVAFITRKITGRMNNVNDTQEGAKWFSFKKSEHA